MDSISDCYFHLCGLFFFLYLKDPSIFSEITELKLITMGHRFITKTRLFKYTESFTPKTEHFQIKNSDIFHISAQNIDCEYSLELPQQGSSNEYPQSMFIIRNKKNNLYPRKSQFHYIKVGFKGVKIIYM